MFSKRHYKVIAQAIKDSRADESPQIIPARILINLLAFHFKLDNPRFNPDAFRKACGEEPTEH